MQSAFEKIKTYLFDSPVLVLFFMLGRPLLLYLSVTENSMRCVLGQHDERGRKERLLPEKEADGLRVVIFDLGKDVPRLGVG